MIFVVLLDEMRNQSNNKNKRLFENFDPYLLQIEYSEILIRFQKQTER